MREETREAMKTWLEENAEERLNICKSINSYDGSMDWADSFDLEELASWTNSYDLARAIIYGNVTNIEDEVRYNGYGNLESVDSYDLEKESADYIEEIIDFIDSNGFSDLYCDELEEIFEESENEEEEEEIEEE